MSIVLDILFPRTCFGCGCSGQYLCQECRDKLVYKGIKKGDRLSIFRYHGAIKNLITSLKFDFVSDIVPELADYLSSIVLFRYPNLLSYWQANDFVFVPVPLHQRRLNWRGYNQSEIICQQLSLSLGLGFCPNIITRTKNTEPQTSIKDKVLRHSNTNDSFKLLAGNYPKIILFDDVYTTGSTINAAKSVFPKSAEIWTLTVAG